MADQQGPPEQFETLLDSTLESVDVAEDAAIKAAAQVGFDEDDLDKIGMSVRECMVNAVVHGNRYNARKKVHFALSQGPGQITVTIGDEGDGFDRNNLPDPLAEENLLRHSGRGLLLMQAFMDEFSVQSRSPKGTEVRIVKKLASQN